MSRPYAMSFANVTVSAAQDLLALYAGTVKAFEVHSFVIGQITAVSVGNLRIRGVILPATVTPGSGGSAGVLNPISIDRTAATITGRTNDTTQATTGGTAQIVHSDAYNVINGYQWVWPIQDRPVIYPGQAFSLSLDMAPSPGQVTNASIIVAELF
jgi:hypothetical protein